MRAFFRPSFTTICIVVLAYVTYILVLNKFQQAALGRSDAANVKDIHVWHYIVQSPLALRLIREKPLVHHLGVSQSSLVREAHDGGTVDKEAEDEETIAHSQALSPQKIAALVNEKVPVLLTKENMRLQAGFSCGGSQVVKFHGYSSLRAILNLEQVIPNRDPYLHPSGQKHFQTCAVVGNSGSLLESQHGQEIDAHDAVFRFNSGITNGYEQFVGSKTTFRIYNRPEMRPQEDGEITVSTARDGEIRRWVAQMLRARSQSGFPGPAYTLDPEFLCHSWQWVRNQGKKPSSGLVGMVMALKLCESVTGYGFRFKNYFSRTSRPHYYDWERPKRGREGVHPFRREVRLYYLLHKLGYLRIVK